MKTGILATAIATALLATTPLMSADMGGVIVQEKQGLYRVAARFVVPQPPSAVLAVLTDYERIPRYLPDVKVSVIRSRTDGHALVEQEAEGRVFMFSKRVQLLLDIRESADALVFADTSGRSFQSYEGVWRVVPREDGSEVIYELHARPAFDVPQFVLMRLFRKDATQMIDRLRAEIATRDGT